MTTTATLTEPLARVFHDGDRLVGVSEMGRCS